MTKYYNGAEGGTSGATVTLANSGGASGSAFGVISGTPTFDNTRSAHGVMAYRIAPATGAAQSVALGSGTAPLGGTSFNFSFYVYYTALPTTTYTLAQANDSAAATLVRVNIDSAGKLTFASKSAGAVATRFTAVNAIPLNSWVRVEVYAVISATAGTMQVAYFAGDSVTPIETSTTTSLTYDAGISLRTVTFGKYGTDTSAAVFWLDDLSVDNAATGMPGPYTEALATPVVTLGATTRPSTVGGSNGSQVVTWAAIPGATSYAAYRAPGIADEQSDFTLVAATVTSPYTFTGLAEGVYSYGIKAKA